MVYRGSNYNPKFIAVRGLGNGRDWGEIVLITHGATVQKH
jgi:hypothetical protein